MSLFLAWSKLSYVRALDIPPSAAIPGKASVARMSEAKSGRSCRNALSGMAGVRPPQPAHIVPSPGAATDRPGSRGQNPDVAIARPQGCSRPSSTGLWTRVNALMAHPGYALTSRRQDDSLAGRLRVEEP